MTTQPLWTQETAVKATQGTCNADFSATGLSIDTRSLKEGDLFIALKGDRVDGHDFVTTAFEAGACAALVRADFEPANKDWCLLKVADTAKAMEQLGQAARARTHARIIGVTGSAGKTGTKEMLSIMLREQGKTHASQKSFNNHWGVPLTLSGLPEDADYGIFEMGMNHAGEMTDLTRQVQPDIAIITTIEPAHIENFPSVEAIAAAKAEIFTGMPKDGTAILNIDNPHFQQLKQAAEKEGIQNILTFGEDEDADIRLLDCTLHADGSKITAQIDGQKIKYRLAIPGKHIVLNSLAALAAVKASGADVDKAVETLKNAEPAEGRGNRIIVTLEEDHPPVTIIDESYNANPASMQAAFSVLEMTEPANGGRRIAVLGDMLELGRDGPALHAGLANPLLKAKTDLLFCCGAQMDALHQVIPPDWQGGHAKDSQALAPMVRDAVKAGDVILVKGSAGSKMAYIVQALLELHKNATTQTNTSADITKEQRNAL